MVPCQASPTSHDHVLVDHVVHGVVLRAAAGHDGHARAGPPALDEVVQGQGVGADRTLLATLLAATAAAPASLSTEGHRVPPQAHPDRRQLHLALQEVCGAGLGQGPATDDDPGILLVVQGRA